MKHIKSLSEGQEIFKALSVQSRVNIMDLLFEEGNLSVHQLAGKLGLTNSAVSLHIKLLEKAGLISVTNVPGKRGVMKICKPSYDSILIHMKQEKESRMFYEDEISIGNYSSCEIKPTCGLATTEHIIGELDNPKYFSFPEHLEAGVLWFGYGEVEYMLPNRLRPGEELTELQFTFEISSESPGFNDDFPSDIEFYLNEVYLGYWISPGDFGRQRGRYSPSWWPRVCNQYGLLKTLYITKEGVFIDGSHKISDVTICDMDIDYKSTLRFKFKVSPDARNPGGLTLFGKGFGNYNQDIQMRMFYR